MSTTEKTYRSRMVSLPANLTNCELSHRRLNVRALRIGLSTCCLMEDACKFSKWAEAKTRTADITVRELACEQHDQQVPNNAKFPSGSAVVQQLL